MQVSHNNHFSPWSKWFTANKLALNLDKTNIIKFITNNSPQYALSIGENGKYIAESVNTKFLGLQIDNHLNWTNHINKLISKLCGAFYAVRSMFHVSNTCRSQISLFCLFSLYNEVLNIFGG
jgi:hypothetical protein